MSIAEIRHAHSIKGIPKLFDTLFLFLGEELVVTCTLLPRGGVSPKQSQRMARSCNQQSKTHSN